MANIENAVQFMVNTALDNTHGYDQNTRTGGVDYDCSSLVGTALNQAGFNVKKSSTTRTLKDQLVACGFKSIGVSEARKRGDIFLKVGHHVVMCTDGNNIVHASINEKGTVTGGKQGDQTGKEICTRSFYNYSGGWDYHFRFGTTATTTPTASTSTKDLVKAGQQHSINFTGNSISVDGSCGPKTKANIIRCFQNAMNLDYGAGLALDGSFGPKSTKALGGHYVKNGETQYMVTAVEIALMCRGYNPNGVECPGHFGNGCEKAVRAFQSAKGLEVDGSAGPITIKALMGV